MMTTTTSSSSLPPKPPNPTNPRAIMTNQNRTSSMPSSPMVTSSSPNPSSKMMLQKMLINGSNKGGKNNNNDTTTKGTILLLPPGAAPMTTTGRSISTDTGTGTACSRDDLRNQVHKRRRSLLPTEHAFLDHLCVHGNDIEVQLAFDRLNDDDLFFDTTSPSSTASTESNSFNQDDEDEEDNNNEGNAAADPAKESSSGKNKVLKKESSLAQKEQGDQDPGTSTTLPQTVTIETLTTIATSTTATATATATTTNGHKSMSTDDLLNNAALAKPNMLRKRSNSIGSMRRLAALEARKQNNELHGHMWKAHASGLAVTQNASRQSLQMRRGSTGKGGFGGGDIFRRSRVGSWGNTSSGSSHSNKPPKQVQPPPSSSNGIKAAGLTSPLVGGLPPRRYQRSQSLLIQSPNPPRVPEMSLLRDSAGNLSETTIRSNASRKSVTFNVDPSQVQPTRVVGRPKFRRSISDSIQYQPHRLDTTGKTTSGTTVATPPLAFTDATAAAAAGGCSVLSTAPQPPLVSAQDRLESNASSIMSIPPIPHAEPLRSESIGSLPSLHRATAVRSDSLGSRSSIPSLHHGHLLRDDSIGSIPSLHHGHLLRDDSIGSVPSLHHGHPVRAESIGSVPSLHHGHPLRAESIGSVPSLHHGQPVRADSLGSIPSLHHGHPLISDHEGGLFSQNLDTVETAPAIVAAQDAKAAWLTQYYAHADEIAETWMASSTSTTNQNETIPLNVTIPSSSSTSTTESCTGEENNGEEEDTSWDGENDDDDSDNEQKKQHPQQQVHRALLPPNSTQKPVLMRLASRNACYEGEGVEVTELEQQQEQQQQHHQQGNRQHEEFFLYPSGVGMPMGDSEARRAFRSMQSLGDLSVRTVSSYDAAGESSDYGQGGRRHDDIFRNIQRSLSDQDMSNLFLGSSASLLLGRDGISNRSSHELFDDINGDLDSSSWDMESEDARYDSWNVLKDEYANGYGGGGTLDFRILGTSADDEAAQPHVLSPPLMESLQAFLPFSKSGENFHLKYSLVRDGASLHTFLKRSRGAKYTVLAMETVDGEVFGSFTAQAWRKNWNYFGTGESFLWKMRRNRLVKCHSIIEQAQMESEVDVFPYTGDNKYIQLCTHDRIAIGGGSLEDEAEKKDDMGDTMMTTTNPAEESSSYDNYKRHEFGFGLSIESDMLTGSTSPCLTFASPSLSEKHSDGSRFEIVNLELWTLTPCQTTEDAEKLELATLFLERESDL